MFTQKIVESDDPFKIHCIHKLGRDIMTKIHNVISAHVFKELATITFFVFFFLTTYYILSKIPFQKINTCPHSQSLKLFRIKQFKYTVMGCIGLTWQEIVIIARQKQRLFIEHLFKSVNNWLLKQFVKTIPNISMIFRNNLRDVLINKKRPLALPVIA